MTSRLLFVLPKRPRVIFSTAIRSLADTKKITFQDPVKEISHRRTTNEAVRDFAVPLTTGKYLKQTRAWKPVSKLVSILLETC